MKGKDEHQIGPSGYNAIVCETRRTFPQGESHDGSPGLDAFHRAKSFGLLFSLSLSSDTLKSPELQ